MRNNIMGHLHPAGSRARLLRDAEEALTAVTEALRIYPSVFGFWIDCFDLALRLRPAAMAADLLARIPVQNRREEIVMVSQRTLLAIRLRKHGEARRILEKRWNAIPTTALISMHFFFLAFGLLICRTQLSWAETW